LLVVPVTHQDTGPAVLLDDRAGDVHSLGAQAVEDGQAESVVADAAAPGRPQSQPRDADRDVRLGTCDRAHEGVRLP
jgi:hypothetical protein